jgi:Fuc2NAc and GlcNAc transferase
VISADWMIWLAPVLAAFLTLILVRPLRRFLVARGLVDRPDSRRTHVTPTPRGGGLAMTAGLCLAALLLAIHHEQAWGILVLMVALAGLGWLDDQHDLEVRWRLLVQCLIAVALVWWIGVPALIQFGPLTLELEWLWWILAVVAVIWLINLHNFMDGSDGLAAAQGVWCGLAFGVAFALAESWFETALALSLSGVCLGFVFWNRPPARIFMGDTGSVLLGGTVAWLALSGAQSGTVSVWLSLIICSLFVVDATATLLRRVLSGERWYTPHRSHAYQRLIVSGWSHGRVLALYAMVNLLIILPAFLIGLVSPEQDFWLALVAIGLLVSGWYYLQSSTEEGE